MKGLKGLSHLFRFSCLSVLVISFIDDSISDSIISDSKISTDITGDYCDKNVHFDVNDSYHYIDDQYRYEMCKRTYGEEFDEDKIILENYKQCLGPRGQIRVYHNPCAVVCPTIDYNIYLDNSDNSDTRICEDFVQKYTNVSRVILIRDPLKECGLGHHCNELGCCVNKEMTTNKATTLSKPPTTIPSTIPTTPPTATQTAAPTTAASTIPSTVSTTITTQNPSTQTTTAQTTITASTTTSPTTLPPQIQCHSVGTFKYPNDATNRKYYRCRLRAELKVCPNEEIFDEKQSKCVSIVTAPPTTLTPTTQSPTVPTTHSPQTTTNTPIDWRKYFKCGTEEGLFRNPYDCTRFYWCYKNQGDDITMNLADIPCAKDQYFDEHPGNAPGENQDPTCVPINDYVRRHGVCKVDPLPSTPIPSRFY